MAGVVEGFRWAALGSGNVSASVIVASVGVTAILIVAGAFYFRRTERSFADII
jgi:lipopolysaccharide transport system permease protein